MRVCKIYTCSRFSDRTRFEGHCKLSRKYWRNILCCIISEMISCYTLQTLSSVKPFPSSLNYTILYRQLYDNQGKHDLNIIWKNAQENVASSLHIPSEQVGFEHKMSTVIDLLYGSY